LGGKDVGRNRTIALPITPAADILVGIEADRHRSKPRSSGEIHRGAPAYRIQTQRVDHGGQATPDPGGHDGIQDGKGVAGGIQIALAGADDGTQCIRGDDLGCREALPGPGGLPGTGRADEHDQRG